MTARAYRDARGRPLIAVTGIGLVSSLGQGQADTWAALTRGRSGIREIARFPTEGLRTRIAGTVDFLDTDPLVAPLLSERFAAVAAEEALDQAALGPKGDFPGPLFIAVPPVEMEWPQRRALAEAAGDDGPVDYAGLLRAAGTGRFDAWHDLFLFGTVADRIAERFGTRGSPISLSTACSSGATAIQLGVEAIRRGEASAALCIGTDGSVNPESLIRFSLLSALSTRNDPPEEASRPFSKDRDGFVMGEGAAALVLEDAAAAVARGAAILGYVLGCGEKGDGFHRTRSSPDGAPILAAIRASLDDAGLAPEAIDTVNAHGTSTPENDRMEATGIAAVFGERAATLPVTSNKSMLGHTLTAAGAIEAVASLLSIRHGRIPPTINYRTPDPALGLDIVGEARDVPVRTVLSNSFGFGGQNTCLVLGAEPA
ncbi:beta-ketoacyl-ACP synthase [Methylobacterium persicinum]|uniref:3-oxoacyl-[acyl-carrier-protein] synthase II n=1 Tax=Methylobacterium persicinum TaxID=374426 RepID=A0ABU0HGN9_9HYPH|nr:beta-ketoacyl-ACP synthase [Methylobacterium persicinum]MDQ0440998.1 3-oxoacyl-[acyl-carrier-protein] synthase II [Methylobacterium persicinum]GJE40005.1 3-oxoacyl-[acyl-carrier-protein] synthase 2 [Methylobacterium persicinum]